MAYPKTLEHFPVLVAFRFSASESALMNGKTPSIESVRVTFILHPLISVVKHERGQGAD